MVLRVMLRRVSDTRTTDKFTNSPIKLCIRSDSWLLLYLEHAILPPSTHLLPQGFPPYRENEAQCSIEI